VKLPEAAIPADGEVTLRVKINLPPGLRLGPLAPLQYLVESSTDGGGGVVPLEQIGRLDTPKDEFEIKVEAARLAGAKSARVSLAYVVCSEGSEGVCQIKSQVWEIPLRADAGAKERVIQLAIKDVDK
jgi:hypothetical protein